LKGSAKYRINESGQLIVPGLLLISGTGRDSGKTTLVCNLLERFHDGRFITAIKISPHKHKPGPGELPLHSTKDYSIFREEKTDTGKDSAAMLKAGAGEVFYVQASDSHLREAMLNLFPLLSAYDLLICESGGLRNFVMPDLFFIIHNFYHKPIRESSRKLIPLADVFITRKKDKLDFDLRQVAVRANTWVLEQARLPFRQHASF
jgi:hypothetical protein